MRPREWLLAATGLVMLVTQLPASAQSTKASFKGEIVATMLPDGRNMKLVQPFGYIDSNGQSWDVPAGENTDGASIPRAF
jgi:hypothetical protein